MSSKWWEKKLWPKNINLANSLFKNKETFFKNEEIKNLFKHKEFIQKEKKKQVYSSIKSTGSYS